MKIQKIRQAVGATIPRKESVLSICLPITNSNTMTQFDLINDKNLQNIIWHLIQILIYFQQIFKKVSDCMSLLLQIVKGPIS